MAKKELSKMFGCAYIAAWLAGLQMQKGTEVDEFY